MKYLLGLLFVLASLGLFSQENRYARPDVPGELMVDVGFSLWSKTVSDLDQALWPSKSVSIYYLRSKKLSEKFRFNYGLGFAVDKIGFQTNVDSIASSSDYVGLVSDNSGNYSFSGDSASLSTVVFEKYSLKNTFVEIPLELRFHPKGSEDGEGFFLSVGTLLGVRIKSKDKLVSDIDGDTYKTKHSGDFGMANIRYGVQARVGWRGIHVFYKQYFNREFRDKISVKTYGDPEGQTFNPTLTTFGINFTGF
ncbi:MAG: hypothetical protein AB8B73_08755 [Ekhidna sp.]